MSLLAAECIFCFILTPVMVCCANVAPGDGDPFCLTSAIRKPIPATQKILLDTQDYREQSLLTNDESADPSLKWISANLDGAVIGGGFHTVS